MKKIISLYILLTAGNLIFAQINQKKCITNRIAIEALANDIEYEAIRKNLINYYQENKNKCKYKIKLKASQLLKTKILGVITT